MTRRLRRHGFRASTTVRTLAVAVALGALAPSPSVAATPTVTEVLQYASAPDAPRAHSTGRRLVSGLRRLGVSVRGFEVLPMVVVRGTPAQLRRAHRLPEVL